MLANPLGNFRPLVAVAVIVAAYAAHGDDVPNGLKPVKHPDDNPPSAAKIALGKQLYFDPRLSKDNTISCASCHDPKKGWSNDDAFATGVGGARGGRSAPTVINTAYSRLQFWDGRAADLEEQALGPDSESDRDGDDARRRACATEQDRRLPDTIQGGLRHGPADQ